MQERDLSVEKLREQNVGMLNEVGQSSEDEASFWVTPPGGAEGLTRKKRHDVRETLVLLEEKATLSENLKDLLRRLQVQWRPPPSNCQGQSPLKRSVSQPTESLACGSAVPGFFERIQSPRGKQPGDGLSSARASALSKSLTAWESAGRVYRFGCGV